MVLFKEKLNLKPPGGSGFAPHLDTPSLRLALKEAGPQNFCTVLITIDPMTHQNGCLQFCPGSWNQNNAIPTILPTELGNPDADGRAGAISSEILAHKSLSFREFHCPTGGNLVVFDGWTPHRSGPNLSPFPRRAVFLTYNPLAEGDFHFDYYRRMEQWRQEWRSNQTFPSYQNDTSNNPQQQQLSPDQLAELDALATIPRR